MPTTSQHPKARIAIQPDFAWDGQDAYLFDIDGTLLRSRDRVHMDSFAASVQRVTGFEITLAGILLHGNTDTAILRGPAARRGFLPSCWREHGRDPGGHAQQRCRTAPRVDLALMPGVEEVLRHLAQKGALLGVATGNLETIGWIKIEKAGLREWFRFGGFSDHFPIRGELIAHAAWKAREMAGRDANICVVGDTPRDIEAAHSNFLPVIAVATGRCSFDELLECKPEACVSSLADLLATLKSRT